jgi:dihydropteroate synthase
VAEPTSHQHTSSVAFWAGLSLDQPRIMGVLNVTPDSFSDGGAYADADAAVAAGLAMVAAGADIVDVGGESTRPDSPPTAPEEELRRVVPVVRALALAGVRVSIDTRNAATMQAALDTGAAIVNDVSALTHDPRAAAVVAAARCPVVLMHMRGTPDTMNARAVYADLAGEVVAELRARIEAAVAAGVARDAIAIDPGIGFAKLAPQSVELLRRLPELAALGRPILVGVSRKSFIGRITGEADPRRRLPASLAAALFALAQGARILRVHNVAETVQALRMWQALTGAV